MNTVEDVLRSIKENGGFDALKKQVLDSLRSDESLLKYVHSLVEGSEELVGEKALRSRKEITESIKKACEEEVVRRAMTVIELQITGQGATGEAIDRIVADAVAQHFQQREQA